MYTEIVLKLLFLKAGHRWGKYDGEGIGFLPRSLNMKIQYLMLFHLGNLTCCPRNST